MKSPTNSQVNKAGKCLRSYLSNPAPTAEGKQRAGEAVDVLVAWRRAHATPLQSATMGLRSRVNTAGCQADISQRLKRIPTILDKLLREPRMALSTMGDVGGCRAVCSCIDDVRRVEARFANSGKVLKARDYITSPRESGYRGVHLIVDYSGRKIEVQLRTEVMHDWAVMVELISSRTGLDVKSGLGPPPVQDWFQAVSEAMAIEEQGLTVDDRLAIRIRELRVAALPHLGRTAH